MIWMTEAESAGTKELTEAELRRIHKRFGHPSVERLWALLKRADKPALNERISRQTGRP
jgi:hypothetical protein